MSTDRCTCPTKFDAAGQVVRAMSDQRCPVHGPRAQPLPHCPTCTCGVGAPIVQTPEVAAAQVAPRRDV
jgi:hypothetical protein